MGGAAGLAGGLAWVVKALAILAADEQPPVVFGLALPLFGLSLVGVALLTSQGFRRTIVVVVGLAGLAVVTGLAALASELLDLALDESIAASALALLTGQMALSRHGRAPARCGPPQRKSRRPALNSAVAIALVVRIDELLSD
jgi:hypothetical protein